MGDVGRGGYPHRLCLPRENVVKGLALVSRVGIMDRYARPHHSSSFPIMIFLLKVANALFTSTIPPIFTVRRHHAPPR
jgi:hypothetical protein